MADSRCVASSLSRIQSRSSSRHPRIVVAVYRMAKRSCVRGRGSSKRYGPGSSPSTGSSIGAGWILTTPARGHVPHGSAFMLSAVPRPLRRRASQNHAVKNRPGRSSGTGLPEADCYLAGMQPRQSLRRHRRWRWSRGKAPADDAARLRFGLGHLQPSCSGCECPSVQETLRRGGCPRRNERTKLARPRGSVSRPCAHARGLLASAPHRSLTLLTPRSDSDCIQDAFA